MAKDKTAAQPAQPQPENAGSAEGGTVGKPFRTLPLSPARPRTTGGSELPPGFKGVELDPPQELKARIVVVDMVYHQKSGVGEHPETVTTRFVRWLESNEAPFSRDTTLGEEWKPVEFGWAQPAGMVVIKNDAGKGSPVKVDPDEIRTKVIEVSFRGDGVVDAYVPPGESARLYPADVRRVQVRCRSGYVRYSVTVYPA